MNQMGMLNSGSLWSLISFSEQNKSLGVTHAVAVLEAHYTFTLIKTRFIIKKKFQGKKHIIESKMHQILQIKNVNFYYYT